MFDLIAFDADDTLWQNETFYTAAKGKLVELLSAYHSPEWIEQRLDQAEVRNLEVFGYGIKGFILSMIETAIELTEGRIAGAEIQQIIAIGRSMLGENMQLFEGVQETLASLAASHHLMLITKGDLIEQEAKIARSGLAVFFAQIEITSRKTTDTYAALLARHKVGPAGFLMVGNSLRSDILPVLDLGGWAVYIPYQQTWAHERVDNHQLHNPRYFELTHIGLLPALIAELETRST